MLGSSMRGCRGKHVPPRPQRSRLVIETPSIEESSGANHCVQRAHGGQHRCFLAAIEQAGAASQGVLPTGRNHLEIPMPIFITEAGFPDSGLQVWKLLNTAFSATATETHG